MAPEGAALDRPALEFRKIPLLNMKKLPPTGFNQEDNIMTLFVSWSKINSSGNV
jgi:hypothetical protein